MSLAGPDGEAVRHSFFMQGAAQGVVAFAEGVVFADGEGDVHAADGFEPGGIAEIGNEVVRGNEVDVLIVMAAEEVVEGAEGSGKVVTAAEGYRFAEQGGVAKGEVHGVVSADAAAVDDKGWLAVFRDHIRDCFVEDVALVLAVALDAGGRRRGAAVEAFGIDGVDAEEAEVAGFDAVLKGVDEAPVFVIEEAAFAGGKDEDFRACVAENQDFHVAVEVRAEPFLVLALHLRPEYGGIVPG